MSDEKRPVEHPPDTSAEGLTSIPLPRDLPGGCECDLEKIRYQAQVDLLTARAATDQSLEKAEADTDFALVKTFHEALLEVSAASISRATSGAESVRTAAAAIGVIYTGVLGLTFSVGDNPLPLRALIPAVFLGIAIVMATAYLAYPMEPVPSADWPRGEGTFQANQEERTGAFIEWAAGAVKTGAYALRAAVAALAFGVAFLPVGFLSLGSTGVERSPEALSPEWPAPPDEIADSELASLLYEAQVSEVAEIRRTAFEAQPPESWQDPRVLAIYVSALIAILITFLHPLLMRLARRIAQGRGGSAGQTIRGTPRDS